MLSDEISVRSASLSDLATVVAFNRAMALETEGVTLDSAASEAGAHAGLTDTSRAVYFMADIRGKAVGQTMITPEWSDWRNAYAWWIQSVYVTPNHRRCGVFRALYGHIRTTARDRGDVLGLKLYVHHANTGAMRTYERLGMKTSEYLLFEDNWPVEMVAATG